MYSLHLQRRVVRQVHPLLLQQLQQHRIAILSGAVDVVERFLGRLQLPGSPPSAGSCPRPPRDPQKDTSRGRPSSTPRRRLGLLPSSDGRSPAGTGVPVTNHLLRVAVVLPAASNPTMTVREGLQHLRGEAGHHVGLVNGRGDPRLGAAFTIGKLAYPPVPMTTSGRNCRRMARASPAPEGGSPQRPGCAGSPEA